MAGERKIVNDKIKRVLVREYLMNETRRAGFGGLDIQRTPMGTRVTLLTERPGLVIGRRGDTIKELTETIEVRFNLDNPQIVVQDVQNSSLNAQIMAEKLAQALERGWHFRRAGHSTLRRVMYAGARGCLVVVSGKLTGQRHRTEKFKDGHIKFCGEPRLLWMEEGFAVAKLKPGVIGVKVKIMRADTKLPDDITIEKTEIEKEVEREMREEAQAAEKEAQAPGATESPGEKSSEEKPKGEGGDAEEVKGDASSQT